MLGAVEGHPELSGLLGTLTKKRGVHRLRLLRQG
jgi:hypothetical protein